MTKLDLEVLAAMDESKLNKLTKAEIIAGIKSNGWMVAHHKRRCAELENTIEQNTTNERAACVMLAAMVGKELKTDDYSNQIDSKQLNILELVGLAAKKLAEIAR